MDKPGPAAWSGDFLSGIERRAAGRPEPLWCPAGEKEVKGRGSPLEESKPSTSKLSQGDAAPPSPRTLKAIEAAMAESSDEEKVNSGQKDGHLSPRTMLAIQEALAEEEDGSSDQSRPLCSSPPKQQVTVLHPAPQIVVSSSEDEADSSSLTVLPAEHPNTEKKPLSQNVHVRDSLLVSSSEDEMEEAITQRNKVLRATMLEEVEEKEAKNEELGDGIRAGSGKQEEPQTRAALNGDLARLRGEAAPCVRDLPISPSAHICVKPITAETGNGSVVSEPKTNQTAKEGRDEVKSEAGEESESEGTTVLDVIQITLNSLERLVK